MRDLRKTMYFLTWTFILLSLISSCFSRKPILPSAFFSESSEPKLKHSEELDGENQEEGYVCLREGRGCWEFEECRTFCEDLFFSPENRQMCFEWPIDLYEDFKRLFVVRDTETFENIEPQVLRCFLGLSERNRSVFFKAFDEETAQEFLKEIAGNPKLAFELAGYDKGDFSLLDKLFKKISSYIIRAVKANLDYSKGNFLTLIHEYENRPAWTWLDDYIVHHCRRDSSCEEPLEYYCKILEDNRSKELEDFFYNQNFKRSYRQRIEAQTCGSRNCEYGDVRDFKELCREI